MDIETFLLQRFPGNGRPQEFRNELANACNSFVTSGLADADFTNQLCSGLEKNFWSRVSEALLAAQLSKVGIHPVPSHGGGGPDFLVIEKGRKIWIEVICSFIHSRSASFIRVCHPLPVALKAART